MLLKFMKFKLEKEQGYLWAKEKLKSITSARTSFNRKKEFIN